MIIFTRAKGRGSCQHNRRNEWEADPQGEEGAVGHLLEDPRLGRLHLEQRRKQERMRAPVGQVSTISCRTFLATR